MVNLKILVLFFGAIFPSYWFTTVPTNWTKESYPDPQVNFAECGRQGKSWVCDPNMILNKNTSDQFDAISNSIQSSVSLIYRCNHIALALAQRIDPGNVTTTTYSQQFASYLYNKWIGQGDCDDGLVIFYSKADAKLAVHVGDGLRHVIPNDTLATLVSTMQTQLDAGAYDAAFLQAIHSLDHIFAILRYELWILYGGVILIIVLFFLAFIYVTRSYKSVIEYHSYSRENDSIGDIQQEYNDSLTTKFDQLFRKMIEIETQAIAGIFTTCPVCLTEYDLCITKTLDCRHTYCLKCLESRVCPICSLDMEESDREVQIRIQSLAVNFPGMLNEEFVAYCTLEHVKDGSWRNEWLKISANGNGSTGRSLNNSYSINI